MIDCDFSPLTIKEIESRLHHAACPVGWMLIATVMNHVTSKPHGAMHLANEFIKDNKRVLTLGVQAA